MQSWDKVCRQFPVFKHDKSNYSLHRNHLEFLWSQRVSLASSSLKIRRARRNVLRKSSKGKMSRCLLPSTIFFTCLTLLSREFNIIKQTEYSIIVEMCIHLLTCSIAEFISLHRLTDLMHKAITLLPNICKLTEYLYENIHTHNKCVKKIFIHNDCHFRDN